MKLLSNDCKTLSPARDFLNQPMKNNSKNGHENLGFLSEKFGFMPAHEPIQGLPRTHFAWDDLAHNLSTLYRNQTLRKKLERMPVLSADRDSLDDVFLLRASVILSIFAHAYTRVENEPPVNIPDSIQTPWIEITHRLKRPEPFLSYIDLIIYNWKVRDSTSIDPMRVENLDLLIPTVNNQEERVFYLTQVEILSQTSPVLMHVINAQEAVLNNNKKALIKEFSLIKKRIQHITKVSLPKINPRPDSKTHVDPIVWAKTVAPFAVPLKEGTQGPSGTSSPFFHLMDVFLQRLNYSSILGQEALKIREWYPEHLRNFLLAVEQISVPSYVANSKDSKLLNAYNEMFEAYAGTNGFLGAHKRKVYGYLEMAFKVGRSVTIGGFQGLFEDKTWQEVDRQLEETRQERLLT